MIFPPILTASLGGPATISIAGGQLFHGIIWPLKVYSFRGRQ